MNDMRRSQADLTQDLLLFMYIISERQKPLLDIWGQETSVVGWNSYHWTSLGPF